LPQTWWVKGGAQSRFEGNLRALATLKKLETAERSATPEEQEILSRYVGWGGLSEAFSEKAEWRRQAGRLRELLTDEEYDSARSSTLNAHYTPPEVIQAMYATLARIGFNGGKILEPALGSGYFFGLMPQRWGNSHLFGVELDSLSARIAARLYPGARIFQKGFEKVFLPENHFDLAIGNVPFGGYQLPDPQYDRLHLFIHDYFFAKSLDLVRPGGIVAFITSKGTLDKTDRGFREYLAERAELLGAIRLPNNAFSQSANTRVTSDIIFLRKREKPTASRDNWLDLGETQDGIPINQYYREHPELVLGKMTLNRGLYREEEATCAPIEGADLKVSLQKAVAALRFEEKTPYRALAADERGEELPVLPDENVRRWSYAVIKDKLYYRDASRLTPALGLSARDEKRLVGLVGLREVTRELIDKQLESCPDEALKAIQTRLLEEYQTFSREFGLIGSPANRKAMSRRDSSYNLLASLERLDENGKLQELAPIFFKRTINPHVKVKAVKTADEALRVSMAERGRVDLDFMAGLYKKSPEEIVASLSGQIYANPERRGPDGREVYELASEYLSGEVRNKLLAARRAQEQGGRYDANVIALKAVQPTPLGAGEIEVRLGATWIDPKYYRDFIIELLWLPEGYRRDFLKVEYSPALNRWRISNRSYDSGNVKAESIYGTRRANAYTLLENILNLKETRIYDQQEDADGRKIKVLNREETAMAQLKQASIREEFASWLWSDEERREALCARYNELFNTSRPREYNGSHLTFPGMNNLIKLKKHQRDAIARILYGGNTLLAHELGAGKTFEMIASIMESKRLGLSHKALMIVPKHLTEQTASEFINLYPNANIMVASKDDFTADKRQEFCARVATGDYDCVIMAYSQFERIPLSRERQEFFLRNQIDTLAEGINEAKRSDGGGYTVKGMERLKKSLEAKLTRLMAAQRKDDVIDFEQLGIDRLYVDEAHNYKNLFFATKMQNVAGVPQTEAQKTTDLFLKCRYLDELTGGRGVVFATGTPVSNSMSEIFTMMRYLQYDDLKKLGLDSFDSWASTFGETVSSLELAPEGSSFRQRTRFAKFYNLPELMSLFKRVADIKTAEELKLPVPELKLEVVAVEATPEQRQLVQSLSERASKISNRAVRPEEDNMLKITSDGRKIGLDQRLIDPLLPDDPSSKVNACVENVFRLYREGVADKTAQLVFCDISTPQKGQFNIYDDIKAKLLARGVAENELAFIHDADSNQAKDELFGKVRAGQVRVLMGSTAKMGAGTNVQDRLIASHDLDCPWRPSDLAQRAGRIVRQGNMHDQVHIYRYVCKNTFDSYLFQMLEQKQKFVSQVMTNKTPLRSVEDMDELVLNFAEVKALCAGDERIKEKMELDVEVQKLRLAKSSYERERYRLQDRLRAAYPREEASLIHSLASLEADLKCLGEHKPGKGVLIFGGRAFPDRAQAAAHLQKIVDSLAKGASEPVGEYRGFELSVSKDMFNHPPVLRVKGQGQYLVELGQSGAGNLTRLENTFERFEERRLESEERLAHLRQQIEIAREELEKPFVQEGELKEKAARLQKIDIELNLNMQREESVFLDEKAESDELEQEPEQQERDGEEQAAQDKNQRHEYSRGR
jgi:N12 class adenine-specific DNA methylase